MCPATAIFEITKGLPNVCHQCWNPNRHSGHGKQIDPYKRIFGNMMKARALPQQITETRISASALNRMTNLGMPISVKV